MTFEEVRAWLEKDGWPLDEISEVALRSRFRGSERVFPLFIYKEPLFITFAVIPYARLPEDPYDAEALMKRLEDGQELVSASFIIPVEMTSLPETMSATSLT